jgi:nucleoside-diphosphate-sugar epimerase
MLWERDTPAPQRVLVTGAAGLLGRAVVRDLVEHGYAVHAIDQRRPEPGVFPEERVWPVQAGLHDVGQIAYAMRGCVAVIHLGAIPRPYHDPDEVVFHNNTLATFCVLQAASLLGIERVAFARSESIYGTAWTPRRFFMRWVPADEGHPMANHDAYGLTKEVDEATARMFARRDRMSIVGLRFAWIATREQQLAQVRERGDAPTPQDASLLFSYVDLRDAARACRLAIEVPATRPLGFRTFNIMAADTLITIPTEEALRRYAPDTEIRAPIEGFGGGFDTSAAREVLGWEPEHSWRDEA